MSTWNGGAETIGYKEFPYINGLPGTNCVEIGVLVKCQSALVIPSIKLYHAIVSWEEAASLMRSSDNDKMEQA